MSNYVKFRVYDKATKQIIPLTDQTYLRLDETGFYCLSHEVGGKLDWIRLAEDLIIVQWTGIQDRNGVDIFEGDIIRYVEQNDLELRYQGNTETTVVEVQRSAAGFEPWNQETCTGDSYLDFIVTNEEVLGNVYQNPELLA